MTHRATGSDRSAPLRVAIIDDEPLIRAGLRAVHESDPDIEVVLERGDGVGVVPAVHGARCDVALMDVRMPRRSGLDAIADLRAARTPSRLVVLTTFADAEYLRRAVELSVDGYVTMASAPEGIVAAVHAVHSGGAALYPIAARWLLDKAVGPMSRRTDAHAAISRLTTRERDVLCSIACGEHNAGIARELFLSEATVKGYVSEVLRKLGVERRVQAAVIAHQAGLL